VRYIIEGTWRGYRSSQDHVCHREIYKTNCKDSVRFIQALRKIHSLSFSDGTALILRVREAKPCEKVEQKLSYCEFIRDGVYATLNKGEKP
jgi:hypothetical protein